MQERSLMFWCHQDTASSNEAKSQMDNLTGNSSETIQEKH